MTQQQTDAQAALAAAALVISKMSPALSTAFRASETLRIADSFLEWLKAQQSTGSLDEHLIPNVDFRSPSQAPTERIDPDAVSAPAAEWWATAPTALIVDPHMLDKINRTPSGKYACRCGEAWPCSQRDPRWSTERTELHGGR